MAPFDNGGFAAPSPTTTDPTALYRGRRERAAALWESVPPERFDIRTWACGSTACALGWLSTARHDGWRKAPACSYDINDFIPENNGYTGFRAAANYFGTTVEEAEHCFGEWNFDGNATLTEVSLRLLALPYTVPAEAV